MNIYLVGGAVRDKILGETPTDLDYVVVGATEKEMEKKGFKRVGKAFPVFIHPKTGSEYALARKEIKKGKGHKAFIFEFTPNVTLEEDLIRRDLTINAMAMDEESKEIIDPFKGQKDLKNKVLKHVSPHFIEDPLRVLRVARFHARFPEFSIAPQTLELMTKITHSGELKTLSSERVLEELSKAFLAPKPYLFFETLEKCQALKELFASLTSLKSCKNNDLNISDWDYSFQILDLAKAFDFSLDLLFSCFFMIFGKAPKKAQREKDLKKLEFFL
ncbi:MAG: multifunctional CCA tRNA nucleotidyl transferase/2'3'-cyclic phosphodiesterase/2'nucleotidase/phosphatase, partial [Bdellovibrionota bacterium]|nr:multifunctional CCA tRNA nucleotidyl transferase/2'3'-cyclic phosphodiesterase/2'nucleotidase/phosphatase [Bdellovibrionota bacterium]